MPPQRTVEYRVKPDDLNPDDWKLTKKIRFGKNLFTGGTPESTVVITPTKKLALKKARSKRNPNKNEAIKVYGKDGSLQRTIGGR